MRQRPQILHLGKWDHPSRGGIEAVLQAVATEFRGPGLLKMLCFGESSRVQRVGRRSILIAQKATPPIAGQPLSLGYLLLGLCLARRVDIVHLHLPNWLAAGIGLLAARAVVVHWHADVVDKGIAYRLLRLLETLVLRRAQRIIVTSAAYMKSSRALQAFQEKCEIVPIGVLESPLSATTPVAGNSAPPPAAAIHCLSIGRLVPYKGHLDLVRAFGQLETKYRLTIIGDGPLLAPLCDEITRLRLGDRVSVAHDVTDDRRKEAMLAACDIFVLSSNTRAEAFGIVILEAMRASKPVVAFRIEGSGVTAVCRDGVSGILAPAFGPAPLAEAIRNVGERPDRGQELGRNGRQIFEREYTADAMVRRISAIYERLTR